jgi:glycosyltransferase involved in cell wall biosynthesis
VDRPRRVALVQRSLRNYRAGFFDLLRADLAQEGIELRLLHSTPARGADTRDDALDVPWSTNIGRRVLRVGGRPLVWQPLVPALREADLVIVEQASQLLLNYRLLLRQALGGPRVAFWGHGRSFAEDPSALGERIKAWVSSRPHWWFAHTSMSADVLRSFGVAPSRITVVDNAIDTDRLRRELAAVSADELERLREELGLGSGPIGLFLGNLRDEKRIDVVVEAAALVRRAVPDLHVVVVGHGPAAATAAGVPWIHVLGPRYGAERAALLRLATVLLVPAAVGLVVLDGLVAGVPLVTSRDGAHGPEIVYLEDGETGVLVDGQPDAHRYANAVIALLEDEATLASMRRSALEAAERYSLEAFAGRFATGIRDALASSPGRTGRRRRDTHRGARRPPARR